MNDLTPEETQFYVTGLYRVLIRFRRITILGWVIVLAGFAGIILGWNVPHSHGFVDTMLGACTILAGLALVYHSVLSLEEYVSVPFVQARRANGGHDLHPALQRLLPLLAEIHEGGWQEAYAAIGTLKQIDREFDMGVLSRKPKRHDVNPQP
jgi:hypothetical protein